MAIKGTVVKILSAQAVVINLGTAAGVRIGDVAHIIHYGEEIKDPAGGPAPGRLEYVKAAVRVSHVQERLATCVPAGCGERNPDESPLYRTVSSDMARFAMDQSPYGGTDSGLNVKSSDVAGMPVIPPVAVGDAAVVMQ